MTVRVGPITEADVAPVARFAVIPNLPWPARPGRHVISFDPELIERRLTGPDREPTARTSSRIRSIISTASSPAWPRERPAPGPHRPHQRLDATNPSRDDILTGFREPFGRLGVMFGAIGVVFVLCCSRGDGARR